MESWSELWNDLFSVAASSSSFASSFLFDWVMFVIAYRFYRRGHFEGSRALVYGYGIHVVLATVSILQIVWFDLIGFPDVDSAGWEYWRLGMRMTGRFATLLCFAGFVQLVIGAIRRWGRNEPGENVVHADAI